jgi:hypothetical protein
MVNLIIIIGFIHSGGYPGADPKNFQRGFNLSRKGPYYF